MAVTRKYQDELLVHGYVREYDSSFPEDITAICFEWYHIASFFFLCGDGVEINEERDIVKHNGNWRYNSCYGSVVMPSISKFYINYEYELEILQCTHEISIGIDDSECKYINDVFAGQADSKNYGYDSPRGTQYNWTTGIYAGYGLPYGESYNKGDVIKMCYNPYLSTLQFWKNGDSQGIIADIHKDEDLSYRLCIYLGSRQGTKVKLLY